MLSLPNLKAPPWLALCAVTVSACGAVDAINPFSENSPAPDCPRVGLAPNADHITAFENGPGRDISNVVFEGEITGFKGECEYKGGSPDYTQVVLNLRISFDLILGPAAKGREQRFEYFVALPEFFPRADGRTRFSATVIFPPRRNRVTFSDNPLEITIPLDENRKGPDIKVGIAFDLKREQLNYNRSNTRIRLRE